MKIISKFWIFICGLIVLSPLGLLLPDHFKAGSAWGEWGLDEMEQLVGYIPRGLEKLSNLWSAPFPDYAFKGWEDKGLFFLSSAYIISAILGVLVIVLVVMGIGKFIANK
ncbi:MAG: PDGLE domain-containing protein [Candidatus Omnitrophica bacterium]|jgi:hypothetical protein|nr:PDGLE domain-containing protein [Candidatus Omnitrophota bacterium]